MELLIMLLAPLPLGYLVRNRMAAYVAYIALHGFAFTFQTLYLLLGWIDGSTTAFGPYPHAKGSEVISYGLVNMAIFAIGLGLVALGARLARRRARGAADVADAGDLITAK